MENNQNRLKELKDKGIKFHKIIDHEIVKKGVPPTPLLQVAISHGNIDILKLLQSGPKLDTSQWGICSIEAAIEIYEENEAKNMIKYLLSIREDINCNKSVNGHGGTLAMAIDENSYPLVEFLIKNNVNVDQDYSAHGSPLTNAIRAEKLDIAKLLIAHTKNFDKKNDENQTALMIAKEKNLTEVIKLIETKKRLI